MTDASPPLQADPDHCERNRLKTLTALNILDTPSEIEFDTIVDSAQSMLGCKIALVSLVDKDRQWFKAKCGLGASETPREVAFCDHAIRADEVLIVPDATRDQRFKDNPLVTGGPRIRFYAGVPIYAADPDAPDERWPMGTLCVINDKPHEPDHAEITILKNLARLVESLLSARNAAANARKLADERGAALHRLDRALTQFHQAERIAKIGSWRLNLEDSDTEWSDQVYAIHGITKGEKKELAAALSFYPAHARLLVEAALQRVIETGEPFELETDFITAQGESRRVRMMGELEMSDDRPEAVIGVFQDVTDTYKMEQMLRRAIATDELTGLASRKRLIEVMDKKIARAKGRNEPLALFLIDLDNFKDVNDRCGHHAGDEILCLMASRLKAGYLADSFAARLGGDEFVLLIDDAGLLANLEETISRLLGELRHTYQTGDTEVVVSATIGACRLDDRIRGRREFIKSADAALYRAKGIQRGSAIITGSDVSILPDVPSPPLRIVA